MMGMLSGPGGGGDFSTGGGGMGMGMGGGQAVWGAPPMKGSGEQVSWEMPQGQPMQSPAQPPQTMQLTSFYGQPGRGSPLGGGTLPAPQGANTFELIPHRVFVGGFPMGTTDAELREFFEAFGNVREVKLIRNPDLTPRGYGFVTYSSEQEAAEMRSVPPERLEFKGRKLNIGPAMRRINLTTRVSDLALAHPAFPTTTPFPFAAAAPQGAFAPPPPGYAAAFPYNFPYPQAQQQFSQQPFYWAPQPPAQAATYAPIPSAPSPPFYQTVRMAGPPHRDHGPSHGHRRRRFDDGHRSARKAGGGGGHLHAAHTTPARDANTPIPPLGHPLTPLTPNYPHPHSANITPPTAVPNLYTGPVSSTSNASFVPNPELTPTADYPNFVG